MTEEIPTEVVRTVSHGKKPNAITNFFKSMCIIPRVCGTCCVHPCKRALQGRKRRSWSNRMELAVATLRTASKSMPRDPKNLRFWTDRPIPDIILPASAVRHETTIRTIPVDYVWPRHLTVTDHEIKVSPKSRYTKHDISDARLLEWSKTHAIALYLHGGAYMLCSSKTHRAMIYNFVIEGDMVAIAPNYKRVPEGSVVDAVEDCFSVYRHLISTVGIEPCRICIMGDSAGGALTVLALCRIRDEGVALPACAVLLSPWTDLDDKDIQQRALSKRMPSYDYLPLDAIVMIAAEASGKLDPRDPRINPMYADLAGLPPMLVHAGEVEVLLPQIQLFVERAQVRFNAEIELKVLSDMIHVGQMFSTFSVIAREAIIEVGAFVHKHIPGTPHHEVM